MQKKREASGSSPAKPAQSSEFEVVVGYENYDCGVRAMQLYYSLVHEWSELGEGRVHLWKFEPLGLPEFRRQAASQAASADMIVISVCGDHPISMEARAWIDEWVKSREQTEGALVLLLDPNLKEAPASVELRRYLKEIATAKGMEFIAQTAANNTTENTVVEERPAQGEMNPNLRSNQFYTEPDTDHWGINE